MMYNTPESLEVLALSIVRNSKQLEKDSRSDTGSVFVFEWGEGDLYTVGSLGKS
jgi:hypothetical protein